ncbi:MAG: glycosyltransferase [Pseudomonadota bacterium]
MRVVIDLQACQAGPAAAALRLAHSLAIEAGEHECIIALSNRFPASLPGLRAAFAGTPARISVFELPMPGSPWRQHACELIRANFFCALGADALFVPGGLCAAGVVRGAPSASDSYATVFGEEGDTDSGRVWQQLRDAVTARSTPTRHGRPCLAYVSPLPPVRSGVADYSAELVPELARYYELELIVDQDRSSDPRLAAFKLRTHDWFEHNAQRFDRVLYHVGNSHAHQHMFALIRRHPGVVVLHDFFLSGVLDNLERDGALPCAFLAALYESHGYTGLLEHAAIGRNAAIWKYPLNKGVLDNAAGVIVHSEFSMELARSWYGAAAADRWCRIPLLRGQAAPGENARERLKLGRCDYLVCSFGMLGRTKLNDELLDAFLASPLGADPRCRLVFVGQNEVGLYGIALAKKIAASSAARRITITGFVTPSDYAAYLSACDVAVQLRSATRGETSASVLDCLLHGIPTIVNAHGSSAALDPAMLVKLPDPFTVDQLAAALAALRADPQLGAALGARARDHVKVEHAPARVGQLYADAIEAFAARAPLCHYQRLVAAMAAIPGPSGADLADAARAIAFNQGAVTPRQLLVDVSAVVTADLKTGIQRVVRSVLLALIQDPPPGWRIEPVFSTGANRPYHYARRFALDFLAAAGPPLEDAPVDLHPGDTFLGLDLFTNGTAQNEDLLHSMRERGVLIVFVVFDLLPVLRPEVFPFGTEQYFGDFLRTVGAVSDGLLCISRSVADELAAWIGAEAIARQAPLRIGYFHLGADIGASAPTFGLPANAAEVFVAIGARPTLLMVGTLEPRKGHGQALAAFERLWEAGVDANLVIVGKQGWMVDKLAERLARHPERERRLFWLASVSDEMLLGLYGRCAALLAASEGEGFGLPLIEAAQQGLPVIARDLPVFREVAGAHAYYFSGLEAEELAAGISAWLALENKPSSTGMVWLTWKESARQLLDVVVGENWYRTIEPLRRPRARGDDVVTKL